MTIITILTLIIIILCVALSLAIAISPIITMIFTIKNYKEIKKLQSMIEEQQKNQDIKKFYNIR